MIGKKNHNRAVKFSVYLPRQLVDITCFWTLLTNALSWRHKTMQIEFRVRALEITKKLSMMIHQAILKTLQIMNKPSESFKICLRCFIWWMSVPLMLYCLVWKITLNNVRNKQNLQKLNWLRHMFKVWRRWKFRGK